MTTASITGRTAAVPVPVVPEGVGVLTFSSLATPATLIDGKAVAAAERAAVAADAASFLFRHGRKPGLATVIIGDDPASRVYVASKHRACEEAGLESFGYELTADATRDEVLGLIDSLNENPAVDGILCQLPVPKHLDG